MLTSIHKWAFNFSWISDRGKDYWREQGKADIEKQLKIEKLNKNIAKNVILFIGDGLGVPTHTAARIYKGQKQGHSGEE